MSTGYVVLLVGSVCGLVLACIAAAIRDVIKNDVLDAPYRRQNLDDLLGLTPAYDGPDPLPYVRPRSSRHRAPYPQ